MSEGLREDVVAITPAPNACWSEKCLLEHSYAKPGREMPEPMDTAEALPLGDRQRNALSTGLFTLDNDNDTFETFLLGLLRCYTSQTRPPAVDHAEQTLDISPEALDTLSQEQYHALVTSNSVNYDVIQQILAQKQSKQAQPTLGQQQPNCGIPVSKPPEQLSASGTLSSSNVSSASRVEQLMAPSPVALPTTTPVSTTTSSNTSSAPTISIHLTPNQLKLLQSQVTEILLQHQSMPSNLNVQQQQAVIQGLIAQKLNSSLQQFLPLNTLTSSANITPQVTTTTTSTSVPPPASPKPVPSQVGRTESNIQSIPTPTTTTSIVPKDIPAKGLPVKELAAKGLPVKELAAKGLPVKELAAKGLPMKDFPPKDSPAKGLLTKDLPAKDLLPAKGLPAKDLHAKGLPAKDLLAKGLPAKDLLAKGLPAKDLPAKGLPAKDLPAKGLPAKDLPMRDLPMKHLPAKDLPMRDLPMKHLPAKNLPLLAETASDTTPSKKTREVSSCGTPIASRKRKDSESKRLPSPFNLFFSDVYPSLLEEHNSLTFADVSKMVSAKWAELGPEGKQKYHKKYEKMKAECKQKADSPIPMEVDQSKECVILSNIPDNTKKSPETKSSQRKSKKKDKGLCIADECCNAAVCSQERGDQFCSNECVVKYCRQFFLEWIAQRKLRT